MTPIFTKLLDAMPSPRSPTLIMRTVIFNETIRIMKKSEIRKWKNDTSGGLLRMIRHDRMVGTCILCLITLAHDQ